MQWHFQYNTMSEWVMSVTADSLVSVWSWHLSSYSAALHFSKSAFCSGSRWSVCNFRAGPRPKSHDSCSSLLAPLNSPLLLLLAPVFRKWTRILGKKKKKSSLWCHKSPRYLLQVRAITCSQVFVLPTFQLWADLNTFYMLQQNNYSFSEGTFYWSRGTAGRDHL